MWHKNQVVLLHYHKRRQSTRATICWLSDSALVTLAWLYVLPLYRARLSGFFVAPETNNYTFWIQADSQASLHFSWSEEPRTKVFTVFLFSFSLLPVLYPWRKKESKLRLSVLQIVLTRHWMIRNFNCWKRTWLNVNLLFIEHSL